MLSPNSIPRHLRNPGDEGYRTPTIEDVEAEGDSFPFPRMVGVTPSQSTTAGAAATASATAQVPSELARFRSVTQYQSQPQSQSNSSMHSNRVSASLNNSPEEDNVNNGAVAKIPSKQLSEDWPLKLSWKERIRHLTWGFFTLTMATGGLANALYAGQLCTLESPRGLAFFYMHCIFHPSWILRCDEC